MKKTTLDLILSLVDDDVIAESYDDDNVVTVNGAEYQMDAVVMLMDDDIRDSLHDNIAPCDNQHFVDCYMIAHVDKYGSRFIMM